MSPPSSPPLLAPHTSSSAFFLRRLLPVLSTVVISVFASLAIKYLVIGPKMRSFQPPPRSNWKPVGAPQAGNYSFNIVPEPLSFTTMHGGVANQDQLWIAAPPVFELDWISETHLYIPEGPSIDRDGNVYFSPLRPVVSATQPN
jgi:hypothetical protein